MKFSYNWLQSFFGKKLPAPEKLAELLTMHSFETMVRAARPSDWVLDIDILPNRMPDASSHWGVAKEIAAILKISNFFTPTPNFGVGAKISNLKQIQNSLKIEIEDKDLCLRYTALLITGIKVGPSPKWLKEKLAVSGLNSINNIVDAGNYVMLLMGQPLHVFDFDKIENVSSKFQAPKILGRGKESKIKKIVVRWAKKGEVITTLDNKKYKLDDEILVIADAKKPIGLAGIKGGQSPGVDKQTKNIVLEAANFNAASIRNASKKLNLRTDASVRFSGGLDPNLTEPAILRLAEIIKQLAGGEIAEAKDFYPKKTVQARIKLSFEKVRSLLGADISDKEIKDILQRLGFKLLITHHSLLIIVPTIRRDLQIEEDLIEEIGRLYGYEKIKPRHPRGELVLPERNEKILCREKIKDLLVSFGFSELYSYSFSSDRAMAALNQDLSRLIELKNPSLPEQKFLRSSLLPGLAEKSALNLRSFQKFRFFEMGNVFRWKEHFKDTKELEEEKLCLAVVSKEEKEKDLGFMELKGAVSLLLESLSITDVWFDDVFRKPAFFHPFRSAQIKLGGAILGIMGEVNSEVKEALAVRGQVSMAEFSFEKLFRAVQEEVEFRPVSRFPSAVRDIALLVPLDTRISEVMSIIEAGSGKFLMDIDLFDVYEGEAVPEGKKNLAFRLVFQSYDKTLTDKEVNGFMEDIIKALEKNPQWEVRK